MKTFTEILISRIEADPKLTVAGVAIMAGLDNSTIRRMIEHERNPRIDTAMKICDALGVSIDEFMSESRPGLEVEFLRLAALLSDDERRILGVALKAIVEDNERSNRG